MIPNSPIPPEDIDFLSDEAKAEWHRIVKAMDHRLLDVDSDLVADLAYESSMFSQLAAMVARMGPVTAIGGKAKENPAIRSLSTSLKRMRELVGKIGAELPIPDND